MMSDNNILLLIKNKVSLVLPEAKVLLFGSMANGTSTGESDWDILILTKNQYPKATKWMIQEQLFPISIEYSAFINLILVQEDDWKTNPRYYSLRKNISNNLIAA